MFFVQNEYTKIKNILLNSNFCIEKTEEAIFNIHKGTKLFYSCEEREKTVIYVNGKYMKIEGKSIFGHRTVEKIMKSSKVVFVKRFDDAKTVNGKYASYKVNLRPEIKIYVYKMVGGEQLKGSIILCQMEHVNLIKELILAHFKNYISHADVDKHVCLFEILKKIC